MAISRLLHFSTSILLVSFRVICCFSFCSRAGIQDLLGKALPFPLPFCVLNTWELMANEISEFLSFYTNYLYETP